MPSNTMMIFLTSLVLLNIFQASGAEDEDVLYFEDIQSEQQREEWASLPLISQTRTPSEWCEVTVGQLSSHITHLFIQKLEEVEEIREMDGRRYIGRFQLADDSVSEGDHLYDTVSGALELRQLR